MIYVYEHLNDFELKILKGSQPFIDFRYSLKERMYYWTRHHLIDGNLEKYTLRLFKLSDLKRGFICTDFEEAKSLSMLIEGMEDLNLKKEYPWMEKYLFEQNGNQQISVIALPVSEYIKHYANDFDQLKLLDFEEVFDFRSTHK